MDLHNHLPSLKQRHRQISSYSPLTPTSAEDMDIEYLQGRQSNLIQRVSRRDSNFLRWLLEIGHTESDRDYLGLRNKPYLSANFDKAYEQLILPIEILFGYFPALEAFHPKTPRIPLPDEELEPTRDDEFRIYILGIERADFCDGPLYDTIAQTDIARIKKAFPREQMHGATTDRYMEKEAWEQIIQFIYTFHHFLPGGTYPSTYYGQDIWSMTPEQKAYLKYRETNEFLKALGKLHDELWDTLLDDSYLEELWHPRHYNYDLRVGPTYHSYLTDRRMPIGDLLDMSGCVVTRHEQALRQTCVSLQHGLPCDHIRCKSKEVQSYFNIYRVYQIDKLAMRNIGGTEDEYPRGFHSTCAHMFSVLNRLDLWEKYVISKYGGKTFWHKHEESPEERAELERQLAEPDNLWPELWRPVTPELTPSSES